MPGNPVYWFSIPVFREEGAPLTDSHRRAAPRSGGRRLQKPAPRTRKRRHGIFFKLYALLVVLSAECREQIGRFEEIPVEEE